MSAFCAGAAVLPEQVHHREIADDRALVLQVVVQAQALVREMLADDGHGEVGTVGAAQRLGQGEAQMTGAVGATPHLRQELLPGPARRTVMLPVGARMLAPVIEILHVLAFERFDFLLDEGIELDQLPRDLRRYGVVHWHLGSLCGRRLA